MISSITKAQFVLFMTIAVAAGAYGQQAPTHYARENPVQHPVGPTPQKVVVITGARFTYDLVEKWIDEYNKVNPQVQIIVESRGTADPLNYDILAEVNV